MTDAPTFENKTVCPHCATGHELATPADKSRTDAPGEGDLSLCIQCGQWGVFTHDGALRMPSAEEAVEISQRAFCRAAEFAWFLATKNRQRKRSMQ